MNKESLRIIFLGTPIFATIALKGLIENGFNVVAVVTAPDKPAGRGMHLQESAVKQYALSQSIPVLQPEKLKADEFLQQLKSFEADLQVVVAFRMLPELVWNMPPMGTINIHGSLLPQYRGAAPINWAIINGEKETGVTTFKLQHEIDTGDLLLQAKVAITETMNAGELHDILADEGAKLLVQTLEKILDESIAQVPQDHATTIVHAPKIFTSTCAINWNDTAEHVYNLIRGLSPYPAAFTILNGKKVKIFSGKIKPVMENNNEEGSFETDGKTYLSFRCNDGAIEILELQMEGKKKMKIDEFLRGNKL